MSSHATSFLLQLRRYHGRYSDMLTARAVRSVTRERNNQKFTSKYKGKVTGDTIKGSIEFERNGETRSQDWEAKREKGEGFVNAKMTPWRFVGWALPTTPTNRSPFSAMLAGPNAGPTRSPSWTAMVGNAPLTGERTRELSCDK